MVVAARAAAKRGAANPRVSATKKSGSDYHVSGEGLSRNWMDVFESWRVQYIGIGRPRGVTAPRRKP
jgi:hypothetical protein